MIQGVSWVELSPASSSIGLVTSISDLRTLFSAALQLGAENVAGWSAHEKQLVEDVPYLPLDVSDLSERVVAGEDPLGDAFCSRPDLDVIVEGETPAGDRAATTALATPWAEVGCTWWLETRWEMPHHAADRMREVRQRLAAGPVIAA
jgi:hypothetical protein